MECVMKPILKKVDRDWTLIFIPRLLERRRIRIEVDLIDHVLEDTQESLGVDVANGKEDTAASRYWDVMWLHIEKTLPTGGVVNVLQKDSNEAMLSGKEMSMRSQMATLCGKSGCTGEQSKNTLNFRDGDQWSSLMIDNAIGRTVERKLHTVSELGIAI